MPVANERLVELGVVGRPHGIRGEVRLTWYADSLDLLQGEVLLKAGDLPPRRVEVRSVRTSGNVPLVLFTGVADRSAAETLRGQSVLVPESALPECADDEVYLHELIGFAVRLDATGAPLGVLEHVDFYGEQELWVIGTPGGKEVYLPAVPEFVAEINAAIKEIRITPPEGLLELYLQD